LPNAGKPVAGPQGAHVQCSDQLLPRLLDQSALSILVQEEVHPKDSELQSI
jgi:hypothetical protein